MKSKAVCAGIFLFAVTVLAAQPRFIVQSGHSLPVTAVLHHAAGKAVVTAGDDGQIKVWDTEKNLLIDSVAVAPGGALLLAVHPREPRYAAAYEEGQRYRITVRDWTLQTELFRLSLDAKPLFIDFSPLGTQLVVCVENWKSLNLFDARDGTALGRFTSGFGIVSFVAFSTRENTVMTCQPSGRLVYWEAESGRKISEVRVPSGLVPVTLSANKVYLVCTKKNEIMLIDVVTGRAETVMSVPGLVLAAGDRQGERLAVSTSRSGERDAIRLFTIGNGKLQETASRALPETGVVRALVPGAEGEAFFGNDAGEVYAFRQNHVTRLGGNGASAVDDAAFRDDTLVLTTARTLFVWQSAYLSGRLNPETEPVPLSFRTFRHPFPGERTGIVFRENADLSLWKRSGASGGLALLDPDNFAARFQAAQFPAGIRALSFRDDTGIAIDQNGVCHVFDAATGALRLQAPAAGINAAALIAPARLVCGKSRQSTYGSALVIVGLDTDETTFLPESAEVVRDLAYDRKNGVLFYLGIEKREGRAMTVAKTRTGRELKTEKTIERVSGEMFRTALSHDEAGGLFYFSLDGQTVRVWDGSAVRPLETAGRLVQRLRAIPGGVLAVNADASLTVWDAVTGRVRFTLSVFGNDSWLLVTRDGYFESRGDITPFVSVAGPAESVPEQLERYRLRFLDPTSGKDSR